MPMYAKLLNFIAEALREEMDAMDEDLFHIDERYARGLPTADPCILAPLPLRRTLVFLIPPLLTETSWLT